MMAFVPLSKRWTNDPCRQNRNESAISRLHVCKSVWAILTCSIDQSKIMKKQFIFREKFQALQVSST